jgi:hypothetical protein
MLSSSISKSCWESSLEKQIRGKNERGLLKNPAIPLKGTLESGRLYIIQLN